MDQSLNLLLTQGEGAYFLATFSGGTEITNLDGGHKSPRGVAKALKIYKATGLAKPGEEYRMIRVQSVPDIDVPINDGAAASCKKMVEASRKRK